ncbi:MAG TPA: response regulator [Victivallales bacterium]|nr:response regulator [Victivallales bacterium]
MSKIKIIAVDDETLNLSIVKLLLQQENLDVATTDSSEKCLHIMANEQFDIVLLDIMMPVINGLDLCKKIKKIFPDVIIIFLTGCTDDEAIENSFNAGGFDYIKKPINKTELIARIHNAIRIKKA